MYLFPEYCNNIIVGVIYRNSFSWYVTKIDIWYLDYLKYYEQIKSSYVKMNRSEKRFEYEVGSFDYFCGRRWGINSFDSVADTDKFLLKIEKFRVSCQELKEYRNIADNVIDFSPALLVDFDKKQFFNYIQEPIPLHEYVPKGWQGKYAEFYSLVPANQAFYK